MNTRRHVVRISRPSPTSLTQNAMFVQKLPILCTSLSESLAGQSAIVANTANSRWDRFPSALWGLSPL